MLHSGRAALGAGRGAEAGLLGRGRSATGSREADLSVFAKLFEDRLKWRLEAETFSRR